MECRVEGALCERAGRAFREVEGRRHHAVQAVHPIALRERQQGFQVKRLAVLLKVVDESADDGISGRLRS